MLQQKSVRDLLSGLVFILFGLAFAYASLGYELGTALRMGPGLFPLVLAGILVALGAGVIVKGLRESGAVDLGPIPWRGLVLISVALGFFAVTVRGLGLGPALFVTTTMSALASRSNGPVFALAVGASMTAFCYLIFVRGLGLTVPFLGSWLGY
jgi:hypothetical protein